MSPGRSTVGAPTLLRMLLVTVSLALIGTGFCLIGHAAYMRGKARLGGVLIDRAYEAYLEDGLPHPPWSWADMHPLARLEVPRIGVRRIVLTGASGSTLAFGLGHVNGTASPGEPGNCAIAGHRDTWSAFLADLRLGDDIILRTRARVLHYRVVDLAIVPSRATEPLDSTPGSRLTLITCYPFAGLLHSPWRFIATCAEDAGQDGPGSRSDPSAPAA